MSQTRSVALVGCGRWGKNIARNFAQVGALKVICDTDVSRGTAMAAELGAEFIADLDTLLEMEAVAAVAIATPAVTHASIASKVIDAGKHVYVEKPIALSVQDARVVAAKARAKQLVLMTGHLLQYHPVCMQLLSLVREGTLGTLEYIYSNRLNQGRVRTEENVLWSLAPHDISVILALAGGKPDQITAMGHAAVQKDISDIAVAAFKFSAGLKAHLFCSWLNPYKEHRMAVIGSKAMAVFEDSAENWADKLILYRHRVQWENGVPEFVKAAGEPITTPRREPLHDEIVHFLECVEGGSPCRTGPAEAIPVLEVLAATQKSLDTGIPVDV